MIKIITIIGARPQFIKAAAVSRIVSEHFSDRVKEIIVHTGQHYDENMSRVFFDELDIPRPGYNLEIAGGGHGLMTGRMLESLEKVLLAEKPDWVLIYGDTNTTLAGALAAAKLHIPVAHVEAGLRSFNMRMPEEVNRIVADRLSTLLFCPTDTAVMNLENEGLTEGVRNVGDVMYDVALYYRDRARAGSRIMQTLGLQEKSFVLATCHRAENTDDPVRLLDIFSVLVKIAGDMPVVVPLHPRTRKKLHQFRLEKLLAPLTVIEPLPFLDMVALEQAAKIILTDSGGVQKEAFFYRVPCLTMRSETEWVETVSSGWNQLVGANFENIYDMYKQLVHGVSDTSAGPYGDGTASKRILEVLTASPLVPAS